MKAKYDIIVIDSPPVLASADASVIATLADSILLITSFGYTRMKELTEAVELIFSVKGKHPGIVLNNYNLDRVYRIGYGYSGVGYYRTKK
jgi:tyrosine-protein kinase Etk/Wzc